MIEEETVVAAKDGLTTADLGGEAVIFDPESGVYYGLNEVGAAIFERIREPHAVHAVVEALLEEYEVGADRLRHDVVALLEEMEAKGLVRVGPEPSA